MEKKKISLLLILLVLCLTCNITSAQTTWYKYHNNPIIVPEGWEGTEIVPQTILMENDSYKMWYSANGLSKGGYATSSDGINWIKYSGNPVLTPGASGQWDALCVSPYTILKIDDEYKMWYSGGSSLSQNLENIGYATSTDGINWVKYSGNPVLTLAEPSSWSVTRVTRPAVIYDNGIYKMWYGGTADSSGGLCQIGYATSFDGIRWTKTSNPVLTYGPSGSWDYRSVSNPSILKDGDDYKMWFSGNSDDSIVKIGYAYSNIQMSADDNCNTKDVFSTNPPNNESIYVSNTLPGLTGDYKFYLVRDKTSWIDGDPICPAVTSNELIAYYPFNDSADDESGYGNNGTVHGATPVVDRLDNTNGAYIFDGVGDYISIPNNSKLQFGANPFTIAAFFKTTDPDGGSIFTKYSTPTGLGIGPSAQGKMFFGTFNSTNGSTQVIGETTINDGVWHHVACVRKDDGTLKIYIDGLLDKSQHFPLVDINTAIDARIGVDSQSFQFDTFLSGLLDDIRIYNRALPDSEIKDLSVCKAAKVITIDSSGHFCDLLWTPPIGDNNFYDIVLDVNGNGIFDFGIDFLDSNNVFGAMTLIKLSFFTATASKRKVYINWLTESEIDNAGFNIYRAESEDGAYVQINDDLIPAEGTPTDGASYAFADRDVKLRKTYFYKLEDVDFNGTATMHGPVSATLRLLNGIGK